MLKVCQQFDSFEIVDLAAAVHQQLKTAEIANIIQNRGARVAIGVGSRGIDRIDQIVKVTVDCLKQMGCTPFIVPAMGSHGGASAEGQRQILKEFGIDEQSMGVRIEDSMETVPIGTTRSGLTCYLAEPAWKADWLLPINRIKPHTDFEGPVQSGLIKMLGIGFGKQKGCMSLHKFGTENFGGLMPEIFDIYRNSGRVGFGIAVVENAYDKVMLLRAIVGEALMEEEKRLLNIAKVHMAKILLQEIDVLVVERFSKDISGAGMDTNITGRTSTGPKRDYVGPNIKRIVVLGLSARTNGNACAISCADFITRSCFNQINFDVTYTNSLSCYNPSGSKIPIVANDEKDAVEMAIRSIPKATMENAKIVKIRDTSHLGELWISEAVLPQLEGQTHIALCR